jgi:hypothetical protein
MKSRRGVVTLAAASLLLAAGCSASPRPAPRGTLSPTAGGAVANPLPPALPCVFPEKATDLLSLRSQSDAVVIATVSESPQIVETPDGGVQSYYTASVSKVVESRSAVQTTLVVAATGGVPDPILSPGQYVLFLTSDITMSDASTTDLETYGLVDGLRGAVQIRNGAVHLECPNYADPANRIEASGANAGEALSAFLSMIESLPMPSPETPHKTGTPAPTAVPTARPSQSGSSDVVLIVPYTTGLVGHAVAPSAVAGIARAGACLAWLDPRSRGGAIYEVHLRVPAPRVSAAESSIQAVLARTRITTAALGAFRDLPTSLGAQPLPVRC